MNSDYVTGCPWVWQIRREQYIAVEFVVQQAFTAWFDLAGRIGRDQLLLPVRFPQGRPTLA
ncbi:hypothetical protein MYSE111917_01090 [Mycobacterium senriense]|uniref:Uncharacterized protein n=1 Tax=Mycobacterium senriense TaxID=2775496 RepID=A0ABN6ILI4_9MYCO|nr:hypothetical protein MTY59_45770 [Mycobacterium senriense]